MRIIHIHGNILCCPSNMSIAHCVSNDGKMGAGLALTLNREFHLKNDFLKAPRAVGSVVALRRGDRFIVNLISKERYFHLPTLQDIEETFRNMKRFLIFNEIHDIAVPELGCGLDRCNLKEIIKILEKVFKNDPLNIYMHHL